MTKNAFITGGNSGIGKEMARGLAEQGYRVIIASRDLLKSEEAVAELRQSLPEADIEAYALDLGDFDDIDRFAEVLLEKMPVIEVLMLNAGLYSHKLRKLQSGFEAMIGIMHFGHFRLAQKLLPAVEKAGQGRIVVTSSVAHNAGKINEASFTDPSQHKLALGGYAQAKLANLLFTRELAPRIVKQGSKVTVNAFHPGAVATGIWKELPGALQKVIGLFLISEEKGADTALWLATAPECAKHNGDYFVKRKLNPGSKTSRNASLARWLWEYSEARMTC